MQILTMEELSQRLQDSDIPKIAAATGLVYNTIKNVRNGEYPTYRTVELLSVYFAEKERTHETS